jgi:hypothetical protein
MSSPALAIHTSAGQEAFQFHLQKAWRQLSCGIYMSQNAINYDYRKK